MKKVLFFAAAVVAMVACNKSESSISISNPEEIGFFTLTQNATRGYITDDLFEQIENPDSLNREGAGTTAKPYFHSSVAKVMSWRDMIVSAYNKTDKTDYFMKQTYTRTPRTDVGDAKYGDYLWANASSPIYWPINKELQFLSYSSKNISGRPEPVAMWDGAKKVSFEITPLQCYQNDIVYAQASGNNKGDEGTASSHSSKGLGIKFYHSQAWLTFNITAVGDNADSAKAVKVDKIVLKNVYNSGLLSFEYDGTNEDPTSAKPTAKWNFFTQNPSDVEVDDAWNVLSTEKSKGYIYKKTEDDKVYNGLQLNMLMPEQAHNNFVLYYTMNEQQFSIELKDFDDVYANNYPDNYPSMPGQDGKYGAAVGTNKYWKMGYHYIYNITLEINEITFAPTVNFWTMVQGFEPDPQAL